MLREKARVGRDLGALGPSIVADGDQRAAVGRCAGHIAQGQTVGGHVQADIFHHRQRADARHLRAIEAGGGQGLVVGDLRDDTALFEKLFILLEGFEKFGQGGAGIAGNSADAVF